MSTTFKIKLNLSFHKKKWCLWIKVLHSVIIIVCSLRLIFVVLTILFSHLRSSLLSSLKFSLKPCPLWNKTRTHYFETDTVFSLDATALIPHWNSKTYYNFFYSMKWNVALMTFIFSMTSIEQMGIIHILAGLTFVSITFPKRHIFFNSDIVKPVCQSSILLWR